MPDIEGITGIVKILEDRISKSQNPWVQFLLSFFLIVVLILGIFILVILVAPLNWQVLS